MLDLIIRDAWVVDGLRHPARRTDIGISQTTIITVGDCSNYRARETILADGLYAAPGFIDCHSHTDAWYLINPCADSKLLQGVTCEIIGNCGESVAPLHPDDPLRDDLQTNYHITVNWQTMEQFLRIIEPMGIGVNVASLLGHGSLRSYVMGFGSQQPTTREMNQMLTECRAHLIGSACGLSTGLLYAPGCYASESELIALCDVVQQLGGVHASHIRDEGQRMLEAVTEILNVARASRVRTVISHHKARGRKSWGLLKNSLALVRQARADGLNIYCDMYPYTVAATGLASFLPSWVLDGGRAAMLQRLRSKQRQEELISTLTESLIDEQDQIVFSRIFSDKNRTWEGKSLAQYAQAKGVPLAQALCTLLDEEQGIVSVLHDAMCEQDLQMVLSADFCMVGSDAGARALRGTLAQGKPHPRAFGTFPRIFAEYVRCKQLLKWEDAVYKMTALPATVFGLARRGQIQPGFFADIVLFDPERIEDRATYADPLQKPRGIEYVLVNGQIAVRNGWLTGIRSGQVIRPQLSVS